MGISQKFSLLYIDAQSKGRSALFPPSLVCDVCVMCVCVCAMYQTALIASIQMHFRMALSFTDGMCDVCDMCDVCVMYV